MRIIFAGTPEFAAQALTALLAEASHEIALVLTQPDRPAGRGMKLTPSPVKQVALAHNLPIYQPSTLRTLEAAQACVDAQADLMIVAAYGLILPQRILEIPTYGCLNIHASLLPRWRGAAPIQRAILAGDTQTGITIMQMDAGLDTGDMLLTRPIPIRPDDTAGSLHNILAQCGAQAMIDTLKNLSHYLTNRQPQPKLGITYAEKLTKEEAKLNWQMAAPQLERQIRAFNPFPGAYTHYEGQLFKIWQAHLVPHHGQPGEILAADKNGIVVACQEQALCITRLQRSGSKTLNVVDFLAGLSIKAGDFFY
jgi:methionyl-tRNA formyltransferase